MKKIISLMLVITLMTLSAVCLSSCGLKEDGAEISVYLSDEVYDFDPAASYTDDNCLLLISLLFEPLFTLDAKGKVQNAAAKNYSFDRKTGDLTVVLRESYWSDETRVLATDFVYAWRRILSPDFLSPAATLLFDIRGAADAKAGKIPVEEVAMNAVNSDTLVISFASGADVDRDAVLRNLSSVMLSPVRASNIQQSADHWSKTAAAISCNGPFHLKQLNRVYGYLTVERNIGYHRPSDSGRAADAFVVPSLIRTLWNTDSDSSKNDYLDRMYDFFEDGVVFYVSSLSPDRRAEARRVTETERLSTYSYVFNSSSSCTDLRNPAIRTILSSVIDRDKIISDYTVFGSAATGLVSPTVMNDRRSSSFRKKGGDLLSHMSLDEARSKLEAAGAIYGSFTISYNADHPDEESIAFYVADLWSELGYDVNPRACAAVEVSEGDSSYTESGLQLAYEMGKFDVIGIDWQMMSANAYPTLAAFSSAYHTNASGWYSEEYDALIESATSESDAKKKAAILHEAEELLMNEMPIAPLFFRSTYAVTNGKMLKRVSYQYAGFPVFTRTKLKKYDRYFFDLLKPTFFPEDD